MMREPWVSILITNYNYAAFLGEAIKSALAQTYARCEVIVVDDGSTDASADVIAKFGSLVKPVMKANGGQASAFNVGFAASRGSLICLLDADDVWMPTKVARIVATAEQRPGAQVICHPVQRTDRDGHPFGHAHPRTHWHGGAKDRVRRSGGCWPHPPTSGLSFRRELLQRVLPMPESNYRTCADLYLATLAPLLCEVATVPETLARYRIHGSNRWASGEGSPEQTLRAELSLLEGNIEAVNATLARLGHEPLDPELNLPIQLMRYRLRLRAVLPQLARHALGWPGESLTVRLKMLLKNLRRCVPPAVHAEAAH
jgi:hypothetical protein